MKVTGHARRSQLPTGVIPTYTHSLEQFVVGQMDLGMRCPAQPSQRRSVPEESIGALEMLTWCDTSNKKSNSNPRRPPFHPGFQPIF